MAKITLQRVYDFSAPAPEHCYLIDRLWPRGISKARLTGVQWLKQVAPDDDMVYVVLRPKIIKVPYM